MRIFFLLYFFRHLVMFFKKNGKFLMKYTLSPYVQFHLALKYLVKEKWYRKQKVLAEEICLSEGHLSDIIKNKKKASFDTQVAIAQACGLSYENMLALGRKIHLKEEVLGLIKPNDELKDSEKEFDLHGGWQPRTLSKDWHLVGQALEIIQSNTKHSETLIHIIESLYMVLKKEEGK